MSLFVGLVGVRWFICQFILVFFCMSVYVGIYLKIQVYVSICRLSVHVSIRWFTSVYGVRHFISVYVGLCVCGMCICLCMSVFSVFVDLCRYMFLYVLMHVGIRRCMSVYVGVCRCMPVYVGVCRCMSLYVGICR